MSVSPPLPRLDPRLLPGPEWVERTWAGAPAQVRRGLQALFDAGRLGGSGYLHLLVGGDADLATEGGCSGLVVPAGALPDLSRFAHRIPLLARVDGAVDARALRDAGAVGVVLGGGATGVAAAVAEGLVPIVDLAPDSPLEQAVGCVLALDGALGPGAARHRVVSLERTGLLVRTPDERAGAIAAATRAKGAGALGIVSGAEVTALPVEDAVAWLHAVQDALAEGGTGVG